VCGVSNITDAERKCHAHKHLFVGRENSLTLIVHFQLFAVADDDGFSGNTKRRWVTTASVVQFSETAQN
jgi:hypothetical protein